MQQNIISTKVELGTIVETDTRVALYVYQRLSALNIVLRGHNGIVHFDSYSRTDKTLAVKKKNTSCVRFRCITIIEHILRLGSFVHFNKYIKKSLTHM